MHEEGYQLERLSFENVDETYIERSTDFDPLFAFRRFRKKLELGTG